MGWPSSSILARVIKLFFLFGKTRVIKLLIIYLILKEINILIYRKGGVWCNLYGFLIIKLQIALHYAVWCGAVMPFSNSFNAVFAVW